MSHAEAEVASQPSCWEQAASLVGALGGALPAPGARVAAVGCGTSFNIAHAYAARREWAGQGETDAFVASELPEHRRYDHVVLFSRTGTTTETVGALRRVPRSTATTAVTASPGTPLAEEAQQLVLVEFADEQAVIQTRFFTTVVALVRIHLGEDPDPMIPAATAAVAAELPIGALDARQHTFLGRGWTTALAEEATLKLRETAQVWAEAHNAMEYRHGPMSIAEPGVLVWCFGPPPPGLEEEVRATGARWEASASDPLAEVIRAQRLAIALAKARGLDPDRPRGLSRSVVLSGTAAGVATRAATGAATRATARAGAGPAGGASPAS